MKFDFILMLALFACALASFLRGDTVIGMLLLIQANQCGLRLDLDRIEQQGSVK